MAPTERKTPISWRREAGDRQGVVDKKQSNHQGRPTAQRHPSFHSRQHLLGALIVSFRRGDNGAACELGLQPVLYVRSVRARLEIYVETTDQVWSADQGCRGITLRHDGVAGNNGVWTSRIDDSGTVKPVDLSRHQDAQLSGFRRKRLCQLPPDQDRPLPKNDRPDENSRSQLVDRHSPAASLLRGEVCPNEQGSLVVQLRKRHALNHERLDGANARKNLERIGQRSLDSGVAVADVEVRVPVKGGASLACGLLQALVENTRGHPGGDAQADAKDHQECLGPVLTPEGQAKRPIQRPHGPPVLAPGFRFARREWKRRGRRKRPPPGRASP